MLLRTGTVRGPAVAVSRYARHSKPMRRISEFSAIMSSDHVVVPTCLARQRYRVTRAICDDVVCVDRLRFQLITQPQPAARHAPHRGGGIGDQQNASIHWRTETGDTGWRQSIERWFTSSDYKVVLYCWNKSCFGQSVTAFAARCSAGSISLSGSFLSSER